MKKGPAPQTQAHRLTGHPWLVLLTVMLQLAVVYVPWLNPVFHTEPLTAGELAICLALSSVVFVAVELEKVLIRRAGLYRARR